MYREQQIEYQTNNWSWHVCGHDMYIMDTMLKLLNIAWSDYLEFYFVNATSRKKPTICQKFTMILTLTNILCACYCSGATYNNTNLRQSSAPEPLIHVHFFVFTCPQTPQLSICFLSSFSEQTPRRVGAEGALFAKLHASKGTRAPSGALLSLHTLVVFIINLNMIHIHHNHFFCSWNSISTWAGSPARAPLFLSVRQPKQSALKSATQKPRFWGLPLQ